MPTIQDIRDTGPYQRTRVVSFEDGKEYTLPKSVIRFLYLASGNTFESYPEFDGAVDEALNVCALDKSYDLLSRSARYSIELHNRLLKDGYGEAVVTRTLNHLIELRLIDDRQYCSDYVASRRRRNYGQRMIREHLMRKGVLREDIDRAFDDANQDDDFNEVAAIEHYVESKSRLAGAPREKLYGTLVRRGFSHDSISQYFNKSI